MFLSGLIKYDGRVRTRVSRQNPTLIVGNSNLIRIKHEKERQIFTFSLDAISFRTWSPSGFLMSEPTTQYSAYTLALTRTLGTQGKNNGLGGIRGSLIYNRTTEVSRTCIILRKSINTAADPKVIKLKTTSW